jgi:hypothetical protein
MIKTGKYYFRLPFFVLPTFSIKSTERGKLRFLYESVREKTAMYKIIKVELLIESEGIPE